MKRLFAYKIIAKYHLYGKVYIYQVQTVSLYIAGPKKTPIGLSTNIHQAQMTATSLLCINDFIVLLSQESLYKHLAIRKLHVLLLNAVKQLCYESWRYLWD